MRYKLSSLMLLTTIVATVVAAITSHSVATRALERDRVKLDKVVDSVAETASEKLMKAYLAQHQGDKNVPKLDVVDYEFIVNRQRSGVPLQHKLVQGGLFGGPYSYQRDIIWITNLPVDKSEEVVNLRVIYYIPWYVFAGRPRVIIQSYESPQNEFYVEELRSRLRENGFRGSN